MSDAGAQNEAILTTWPFSPSVAMQQIFIISTLLLHLAHADLISSGSGSSSQENSSEWMGNDVPSLKDRGHVLENETTTNKNHQHQEIASGLSEDTPKLLMAVGPDGGPRGIMLDDGDTEVSFRGDLDEVVAIAQMIRYGAGGAVQESGNIVFHQARPLQAVRILGTLELVDAPTSVRIEIHTNEDISNLCQNVGRIYNPFGVSDGGMVLRSGATIQTNYVSFFKEDRNIFQLTLYGGSKVIGKSVVVYNQNSLPVACGIVRLTANTIGGAAAAPAAIPAGGLPR